MNTTQLRAFILITKLEGTIHDTDILQANLTFSGRCKFGVSGGSVAHKLHHLRANESNLFKWCSL